MTTPLDELKSYRSAAPLCEEHQPTGGTLRQVQEMARRYQYMITNGTWRRNRSRDDGSGPYAEWCIRFPVDADLSCPATREQEIDALAGKVSNQPL